MTISSVAQNYLIDFGGCDPALCDDAPYVRSLLSELCQKTGLSCVSEMEHQFTPYGLTVLFVLAESHLAYHSWPEHGFCSLDLFVCQQPHNLEDALQSLAESLGSTHRKVRTEARGFAERIAPTPSLV